MLAPSPQHRSHAMSTSHSITIEFEVHDEDAFRQAAQNRAIADGLEEAEAAAYLDEDKHSIGDCAVMLFDPGVSPDGCSILGSSGE